MIETPIVVNRGEFREEIHLLTYLLDHPEPGLVTWNDSLAQRVKYLRDIAGLEVRS